MTAHSINDEFASYLWKYTGGFPATALMMWFTGGKERLIHLIERVKDVLIIKNKITTTELPWKHDDLETRLSYTYYASSVVFQELRSKNYAYVALCIQPAGVSADELVMFCGCNFHRIYTCNNQNVKDVYDKVFNGMACYLEPFEIQILNVPCFGNVKR
jgi:hypothetical protein